jgi:hypothetical protein
MKKLWNVVNGLDVKRDVKAGLFLWILIIGNIGIGGGLWFLFGRILFPGIEWLLCFIGYPAILVGFFGGILYLYKHEFA